MKQTYVQMVKLLRAVCRLVGILNYLDKHLQIRWVHWLRSLFAIHDLPEMVKLDIPWWTYGAIDSVDKFLKTHPNARVFEYGSGASTIWLSRRAEQVVSVEHDAEWHSKLREYLSQTSNVSLKLAEGTRTADPTEYCSQKKGTENLNFENYVQTLKMCGGKFDLIIIDGRARSACLNVAAEHLAPEGMIVFDNANRRRYRSALDTYKTCTQSFSGLTPALPFPTETKIIRQPFSTAC